jgi:hypothetical protein
MKPEDLDDSFVAPAESPREKDIQRCICSTHRIACDVHEELRNLRSGVVGADVTEEQVLWAVSMVITRLQVRDTDGIPALAPLLDLINYHSGRTSYRYAGSSVGAEGGATFEATRALTNEEVTESYGGHLTTQELWLLFGIGPLHVISRDTLTPP